MIIEDSEFLRPKYEPQHPLELETSKFIKDKQNLKKGDVLMGVCEEDLRAMAIPAHETTYSNVFNFFSIAVVRMKRDVFETLKSSLKDLLNLMSKNFMMASISR